MIAKSHSRVLLLSAATLLLLITALTYVWRDPLRERLPHAQQTTKNLQPSAQHGQDTTLIPGAYSDADHISGDVPSDPVFSLLTPEQQKASNENMQIEHNVLYGKMTDDRKWFAFDFLHHNAYNPSVMPHPYKNDTWFIIAQRDKSADDSDRWNVQLVCEAVFNDAKMQCTHAPLILPIASTVSSQCIDDLEYINRMLGPHDARIFHGPDRPYVMFVSQSEHSCLGQWLQDFRRVSDWSLDRVTNRTHPFFWPTDLQRPPPYGRLEKNWFVFWDIKGDMYLHYNIAPRRTFARVLDGGAVGEDLASLAKSDHACLKHLMPKLNSNGWEWIHQATNSLAITLCNRADPDCQRTHDNTYIFVIFQKKTFYNHGVYSPYVMLFKQTPPFEVYGISSKPFWYNGRGRPMGAWHHRPENQGKPISQSEMVFTTQIAWKEQGLAYQGFLDDDLFISFGIEDRRSGGIVVTAGDLLADLALCSE